ncbi:MAG TPA: DUF5666 domain-containing protein [Xanthomonadales bacterium]|nr:DUF5666 domain-containing protein [Xanthomonadales bacterium]
MFDLRRATAALAACLCLPVSAATIELTVGGRPFPLPDTTPVTIDGAPALLGDLAAHRNGLQARIEFPPAAADGATPTLVFAYTLMGPVTQADPPAVLGQPLTITADTVVAFLATPPQFAVGQQLVVSGLVDANGSILATLVEKRPAPGNVYLLGGYVQQVDAAQQRIRVGAQWVATNGVAFADCAGALPAVGDHVVLRANAFVPFPPGTVLDTVFDARCATPAPAGTPGATGFLQGLVTSAGVGEFAIGPLVVAYDDATTFEFGGADDLAPGIVVAVDGAYVDATHFAAEAIEFVRPVVRFEVPMLPSDVTPGVALRPFGVEVRRSAQVRDEDGVLANGLAQPRQVEVRGWLDTAGRAWATRVRTRGAPDAGDVVLRGPAQGIADPQLVVQGLTVDTSGATFFDHDEQPMTRTEFFAALAPDDEVDVSGAAWNAATGTLAGGAVTLVGTEPVPPPPGAPVAEAAIVGGTASGYALPEAIFANGYD